MTQILIGIKRRLVRLRRRRKIGRAYDMALEIARAIPPCKRLLDVGCGNGFIGHHLASMLRSDVVGLDVGPSTTSHIDYVTYDGRHFPVKDQSFDVVLLCYVLHHAASPELVLNEVTRVLRVNGLVVIYEDIPGFWWDRVVCWTHNLKWQRHTGPCTFRLESAWQHVFTNAGFETILDRPLSRWRNLAHPVSRHFYLLKLNRSATVVGPMRKTYPSGAGVQKEVHVGV